MGIYWQKFVYFLQIIIFPFLCDFLDDVCSNIWKVALFSMINWLILKTKPFVELLQSFTICFHKWIKCDKRCIGFIFMNNCVPQKPKNSNTSTATGVWVGSVTRTVLSNYIQDVWDI